MSGEQVAPDCEMPAQMAYDFFLSRPIKIDKHVPAKNDIHLLPKSEVLVHEIEPAKPRLCPKLRDDPYIFSLRILAPQKVSLSQIHRDRYNTLFIIDRCFGRFEHLCGYVGSEDHILESGSFSRELFQDHSKGIDL